MRLGFFRTTGFFGARLPFLAMAEDYRTTGEPVNLACESQTYASVVDRVRTAVRGRLWPGT